MKITTRIEKIKYENRLNVCFDVSKEKLDYFFEYGKGVVTSANDIIANDTSGIEKNLKELLDYAEKHTLEGLNVFCESTGAYSNVLINSCHRLQIPVFLISGEFVSKMKVIESNDAGKTDKKDPRVMNLLARLDKVIVVRKLPEAYEHLRELNRAYDRENEMMAENKIQIHHLLVKLFPDYPMSQDFIYTDSGIALLDKYILNPYTIIKNGYKKFYKTMHSCSGIHPASINKIWEGALNSIKNDLNGGYVKILETRLKWFWEEYTCHEKRLNELRKEIERIYDVLSCANEQIPKPEANIITKFRIARILGETGPLSDFNNRKQFLKYAGINLRERASGYYTGKVKMSKKGRITLRLVLGQVIFPLIKKNGLYGEYYHRKKTEGMPGTKAMACVMRKFLKLFYKLSKKGLAFDSKRVFMCESEFRKMVKAA